MKKFVLFFVFYSSFSLVGAYAQLSPLHVDGRYLKNESGAIVNLHGFAQTYSPWFNERGSKWTNYDVAACLKYNKGMIDQILQAGWKMTFVRQHMDPYWSNTPGVKTEGENDISAFSMERFKKYLNEVFIPMAEYAQEKGLYVVMRPPGVCPQQIAVGDAYQKYLMQVWGYVAQQEKLRNNMAVMFELANEPVKISPKDGSEALALHDYFQAVTDTIRHHCQNIVLVPGTGWQSNYTAFAQYPITGENVGYAVHCYPGWYNSGVEGNVSVNYQDFRRGWKSQIGPVSDRYPVVVTEMDWAPEKYNASWGKAVTGTAGGTGFGANFKKITDECGNVSWLIFTEQNLLAQFKDEQPSSAGYTFLTDPEACPWPCYHWYQAYADTVWAEKDVNSSSEMFPLTNEDFNPSIWEQGTFDETTSTLRTGKYGFGGWEYAVPLDLTPYKYLVVELARQQSCGASFRIYDEQSYWTSPYMQDFDSNTLLTVDLASMQKDDGSGPCDASHIYRIGFWSLGGSDIQIKRIFLSNDGENPAGIEAVHDSGFTVHCSSDAVYTLTGAKVGTLGQLNNLPRGLYIIGGKKYIKQ